MIGSEIIEKFELQVDDLTELSSDEELDLMNEIYNDVCSDRPWEFLKTEASGTILSDATGSYATVPANFSYFSENNSYTDNSMESENNAAPKVIFVGPNRRPIQIVNFSDRRQYANKAGYAYLDLANNKIYFTFPPTETTYEFDYIKTPDALTLVTSPIFPAQFHKILKFGMAMHDSIIQQSPKAESYQEDNERQYNRILLDMQYYNAQLQNN